MINHFLKLFQTIWTKTGLIHFHNLEDLGLKYLAIDGIIVHTGKWILDISVVST